MCSLYIEITSINIDECEERIDKRYTLHQGVNGPELYHQSFYSVASITILLSPSLCEVVLLQTTKFTYVVIYLSVKYINECIV